MNNSAFNFQALSPDLILDALESVGLRAESGLTALNSYENRVYQFLCEDRKRYVVKFYRPERWTEEQIHEEHRFSHDMSEAEIPAVAPLAINENTLHHHQGYMFTVFPSVGGRQYEIDNLDQLEWVGRFLGRIHQVGRESLFTARPTMGLDEYFAQPREVLAKCPLIPKSLREPFLQATDNLINMTKSIGILTGSRCVCMAIVIRVIFSGVMARFLSIWMMRAMAPRYRISGCYFTVIRANSAFSWMFCWKRMKNSLILMPAN